jgi:hypothetical protein
MPVSVVTPSGRGLIAPRVVAVRSATAGLRATAVVATVILLVVLQVPDAIAWSPPPHLAAGGPVVVAGLRGDRTDRADQPVAPTGGAVLAAALAGAALALLTRRPHPRALTAVGLFLAALGLGALDLAGLAAPSDRMLTVLCAPVAGGLAAALTASLRALTGARTLTASLRSAADRTAAHAALAAAAGHLVLLAAAVTGVAALALTCTSGRRSGRRTAGEPEDLASGAPVPGAGDIPDHG